MSDASKPKQSIPGHRKYTVQDFHTEFPDSDACLNHIMEARWPDGKTDCGKCRVVRKHYRVTGRTAFACEKCGNHIYPMAGTIFEKSSTNLWVWFYAIFQVGSTRCGISAKQLQRETGVTYKTAWRIMKQVRTLMSEDIMLGPKPVELDESYFGGHAGNRHTGKRGGPGRPTLKNSTKTPAFGMVERGGRVVARVTPDSKKQTIYPIIKTYVMPHNTVYTDEFQAYASLSKSTGLKHRRVNHQQEIFVSGEVHTNTIEGFWSLVKRGIGGVYHSVSREYLQTYLDEYAFRFNRRNAHEPMFVSLLARVSEVAWRSRLSSAELDILRG
jgi:transposase-like protein